MARQLLLIVCMALGASALRLKGRLSDIGTVDSSNCTWTEWSECKVESDSRCARERIFEPLSFENQSADIAGKVPCFSQAGQVELETCQGGRCPVWSMGNWTDCSATCNTTMKPWEGFQRREVECVDASGILYRSDICANVYGVSSRPDQERACECSHKLQVYNPMQDVLTFMKCLYAVQGVPFPSNFDPSTLCMMQSLLLVDAATTDLLFTCASPPIPGPPQLSQSVFFPLSKSVWDSLDSTLVGHFFKRCEVYHQVSGNRLLLLTAEPAKQHTAPARKLTGSLVRKTESMYRTNWNKKFPLGVSNPLHSQQFESPDAFATHVLGATNSNCSNHYVSLLDRLRQGCGKISVESFLGIFCPLGNLDDVRMLDSHAVLRQCPVVPSLCTSQDRVALVVSKVAESILPPEFFGSGEQWRRGILEYLALTRFDSFDTDQLLLTLRAVPRQLNRKVKGFIFRRLIVPLISFMFYVTETDSGEMVFIRRPVWDLLVSKASSALVELLGLEKVCAENSELVGSTVRWLPKKAGLRPVVRQPKHVKDKSKKLLRFLNAIRAAHEDKLGISVFSRDCLFQKLHRFLDACNVDASQLHYVSADIRNCFESIPFRGLENALQAFGFDGTTFSSVMVTTGRRRRPVVFVRNDLANLIDQLPVGRSRPVVVTAAVSGLSQERLTYANVVSEVMRIVRAGSYRLNTKGTTTTTETFRVTTKGLPQGSSFSVMLVNIYYGFLDSSLITRVSAGAMLVRLVDDVLCLSSQEEDVITVRESLVDDKLYGEVNEGKLESGHVTDGTKIHWAGFTLSPREGRINVSVKSGAVEQVREKPKIGQRGQCSLIGLLGSSLGRSLAQHCLPILLDKRLNCKHCVNENAYRAGTLTGKRIKSALLVGGVASDTVDFLKKLSSFAKRRFRNDPSLFRQFRLGLEHSL